MDIIAHRGFWLSPGEKNTPLAFSRAFENGFGVETDFRDVLGRLVISHDLPINQDDSVEIFLSLYATNPVSAPIAINIKSDGLQDLVFSFIKSSGFKNSFVFDMTVPDMRGYYAKGIPVFSRVSDQESPAFLGQADGIWLDAFEKEALDIAVIEDFLALGKKIAFVSSELHGRSHHQLWEFILRNHLQKISGISICTDFPQDAKKYFGL